jgi:uncharacterized membrane protein YoaK (UPF0700 family)
MAVKYLAALLAFMLFVIFNGAIAVKMKEISLTIVILIGFVMMAADLYQSLKSKDD